MYFYVFILQITYIIITQNKSRLNVDICSLRVFFAMEILKKKKNYLINGSIIKLIHFYFVYIWYKTRQKKKFVFGFFLLSKDEKHE